jgi:hypothetical protein
MIKYGNYLEVTEQHNDATIMFKVVVKLKVGDAKRTGCASSATKVEAMDEAVCDALSCVKHFVHIQRFSRNGGKKDSKGKESRMLLKEIVAYYNEKLKDI